MRAGFPRHANRLKQDFQDLQDFTGLGLWRADAVVAGHEIFDLSEPIILLILSSLVNPAHILLIFFNLTKT